MRRIAFVATFLAALLAQPAAQAQVKFSGLPAGSAVSSTDITAFDQGTPCPSSCTTVQVTAAQIRTFVLAFSGWTTQSANTVLAGPTSGAAAAPGFRALVGADLPNPGASSLGGVESFTVSSHNFLTGINTSGVPQQTQPAASDLSDGNSGTGTVAHTNGATFVAPVLGTPASVNLVNASGCPVQSYLVCVFEVTGLNVATTGDLGSITLPAGFWSENNVPFLYNCSNGASGTITATVRTAASGGGSALGTFTSATPPASGNITAGTGASTTLVFTATALYFNSTATTATGTCSALIILRSLPAT
jgi:hypothetical protein